MEAKNTLENTGYQDTYISFVIHSINFCLPVICHCVIIFRTNVMFTWLDVNLLCFLLYSLCCSLSLDSFVANAVSKPVLIIVFCIMCKPGL